MIKKLVKITLLLIWLIIIFCFSSDTGIDSTNKSDSFIIHSIEFIKGNTLTTKEKKIYIDRLVIIIRKGAHFTIYFILGILVFSLLKEYRTVDLKTLLITISICFLYACSDEFHQLFVSGRSARIFDIFIDTLGSISSSFIYLFITNFNQKKGLLDYEQKETIS